MNPQLSGHYIYLYMNVVDEDDIKIWRTIYKEIYEIYSERIKMFTDEFFELCKRA